MQIGNITLENRTVMAPLAGITNLPFRLLVKKAGCGLVCSEMISSNGLVYKTGTTYDYLISSEKEKPVSMQIFGSDPDIMAKAAKITEHSGTDILDINCGCSVRKVLKTGSGSALMKDSELAAQIFKAVRKAVSIPFTVKIRSGWDRSYKQAFEIAKIAENEGVDALALHPRTATQGFSGMSDWSLIKKIKEELSIPVIGNGDIKTWQDALKMKEETGCDAVMIGRAAIGNPMLFTQVNAALKGEPVQEITLDQHFEIIREYLDTTVEFFGEKKACYLMRGRLGWFVKGYRNCTDFRRSLTGISSYRQAQDLIDQYYQQLVAETDET